MPTTNAERTGSVDQFQQGERVYISASPVATLTYGEFVCQVSNDKALIWTDDIRSTFFKPSDLVVHAPLGDSIFDFLRVRVGFHSLTEPTRKLLDERKFAVVKYNLLERSKLYSGHPINTVVALQTKRCKLIERAKIAMHRNQEEKFDRIMGMIERLEKDIEVEREAEAQRKLQEANMYQYPYSEHE